MAERRRALPPLSITTHDQMMLDPSDPWLRDLLFPPGAGERFTEAMSKAYERPPTTPFEMFPPDAGARFKAGMGNAFKRGDEWMYGLGGGEPIDLLGWADPEGGMDETPLKMPAGYGKSDPIDMLSWIESMDPEAAMDETYTPYELPTPMTKGESLLQMPERFFQRIGKEVANVPKSVFNWLGSPTEEALAMQAAEAAPGEDWEVDPVLAGLSGRTGVSLGKLPPMPRIPAGRRLEGPDYSAADAAFEAARPGELATPDYSEAERLLALSAPKPVDPERLKKMKRGSALQGMAQGFFQSDPSEGLGQQLLALGMGGIAGLGGYEESAQQLEDQYGEREREFQGKMGQFQASKAEGIANVANQEEANMRAWRMQAAGMQHDRAVAAAQLEQAQAEMDLRRELAQAELDREDMARRQTTVLSASAEHGYLVQEVGPDGERSVKQYPAGMELGLGATFDTRSTEGKAMLIRMSRGGPPGMAAIVQALRMADVPMDQVFGAKYTSMLNELAEEELPGGGYSMYGAQGQQQDMANRIGNENFRLGMFLLNDQALLKRALGMLFPGGTYGIRP